MSKRTSRFNEYISILLLNNRWLRNTQAINDMNSTIYWQDDDRSEGIAELAHHCKKKTWWQKIEIKKFRHRRTKGYDDKLNTTSTKPTSFKRNHPLHWHVYYFEQMIHTIWLPKEIVLLASVPSFSYKIFLASFVVAICFCCCVLSTKVVRWYGGVRKLPNFSSWRQKDNIMCRILTPISMVATWPHTHTHARTTPKKKKQKNKKRRGGGRSFQSTMLTENRTSAWVHGQI